MFKIYGKESISENTKHTYLYVCGVLLGLWFDRETLKNILNFLRIHLWCRILYTKMKIKTNSTKTLSDVSNLCCKQDFFKCFYKLYL